MPLKGEDDRENQINTTKRVNGEQKKKTNYNQRGTDICCKQCKLSLSVYSPPPVY